MFQEVEEADFDHNDAGEDFPRQHPPVTEDVAALVPSSCNLVIPTRMTCHEQLSADPENWIPLHIHTAKCDRCGQHNTSVVQRSSRENKQFCKPCMHLNVSDGIYNLDVESLNWTPQNVSIKRTAKSLNPSKKRVAVPSSPTRASKRKLKEPKSQANKRTRLAEQPERESRSYDSLFVREDDVTQGEETDDNVDFGQLPSSGGLFSSDGQDTTSAESTSVAETTESTRQTEEYGEQFQNMRVKETESPSAYDFKKPEHPPWWEQIQVSESSARAEPCENSWDNDVHFSLTERRRSEFSPEAIAAANILVRLSRDPRGISNQA
jgi:hypothetical protein